MTAFLLILAVTLLLGVVLAAELLRLAPAGSNDRPASESGRRRASDVFTFAPMARLFSRDDLDLLSDAPDLRARLGAVRRRAMRLYLGRLRADYLEFWSVCRLLAPVAEDQGFVLKLLRQAVGFHALWTVAHLRCCAGFTLHPEADVARLTRTVQDLRQGAARLLQAADEPLAARAGA